eukprot:TRINITY_DN22151_c0_g1_i1.p2 TRINITY_DN22151_c0_g1~~TRINITY_DN22151_c0_g1_i1.p2  ORF type:complete len:107 (+),score=50.34 TRINITY_DN22151_c0_g1_i1:80-400(+)
MCIRDRRADDAFMAEVEKTVEDARKGGNWQLKSGLSGAPTSTGATPAPQTGGNMEVTLSDDDDLEGLMPVKGGINLDSDDDLPMPCLLYTSPSPRDRTRSRMPSSA